MIRHSESASFQTYLGQRFQFKGKRAVGSWVLVFGLMSLGTGAFAQSSAKPANEGERQVAPDSLPASKPETPTGQQPTKESPPAPPPTTEPPGVLPDPSALPPLPPATTPTEFRTAPAIQFAQETTTRQMPAAIDRGAQQVGPPVVTPGFYGHAPNVFVPGPTMPAQPLWQVTGSLTIGYDDNVNQSSDSGLGEGPVASGFTSLGLNATVRGMGRLRLFTVNANAGVDLYWSQQSPDYNLDLGVIYHRQFIAPSEITANLRLAYLSRPDYSQVNFVAATDEEEVDGNTSYFLADARVVYTYHWTPQLSTATSLGANSILYQGDGTDGSYATLTLGNEFRYRSGRFTWIAEPRYAIREVFDAEDQNSSTLFLLGGADWRLGPWLSATVRVGGQFRDTDAGERSSSPYGELGIGFRPNLQHAFTFRARYGFESSDLSGNESETFRVGLGYTRTFSPRLSGSLSANYVQNTGGRDGFSERTTTWDGSIALHYRISSRLSLSASLSSTRIESEDETEDLSRNRAALSANYHF